MSQVNIDIKILFIYPAISFRGYFCRDKNVYLDKRIDIITEEEIEAKKVSKKSCSKKFNQPKQLNLFD